MQTDGVLRQAGCTEASGDLATGDGADYTMDVADREAGLDPGTAFDRRLAQIEQRRHIERLVESVVLVDLPIASDLRTRIGLVEDVAEIESLRLPVIERHLRLEPIDAADHLLETTEAELGHDLAQVARDEAHEVHHMLRITREAFTQPRILRRDARRTGVEVTDAHHDAADRHQRRGGEPELLGTEQRSDRDIASRLQLPIGLDRDAAAQIVEHEGLVRLG